MFPQVDQLQAVTQAVTHQLLGGPGYQHLPTAPGAAVAALARPHFIQRQRLFEALELGG